MHKVTGDGINVTMDLTTTDGKQVRVLMPKLAARKFAAEVKTASEHAEPTCNDQFAHWSGHCNCR